MFVSINKKQAILSVDNQRMFYELVEQDEDFLFYNVSYSIDIVEAISAGVENLKITAKKYTQPVTKNDPAGSYIKSRLDRKIITARRDRKQAIRNKKKNILAELNSNIKNQIDNDLFFQIKNFFTLERKPALTANGLVASGNSIKIFKNKIALESIKNINDSNKAAPVIELNSNKDKATNIDQRFITDLILKENIDPASIADANSGTITYSRLLQGFSGKQKNILKNRKLDLLKKNLTFTQPAANIETKDINNQELLIPTRKNTFSNLYTFTHRLAIQKDKIEYGNFILTIELLDADNITVDSTTEIIKIKNQQSIKSKIKHPPKLSAATFNDKIRLTLSSIDKNTKNILFYRKHLKSYNPILIHNSYEFLGQAIFTPGIKTITKDFITNSNAPAIYRVIAEDKDGNISPLFTSIVVSDKNRLREITGSAIETISLNDGVKITINEFPRTAIAAGIVRRDTTLSEKIFSLIEPKGEQIRLIDNNFSREFIDKNVKKNHVYEYAARFFYKNGDHKKSGNSIIEFIPLERSKYFTTITTTEDIDEENNLQDFSFSINTEITDEGLNFIKDLLDSAGIREYFNSDLQLERDKFDELLAYSVTRTNLTTGQIETFGNISGNTFSDSSAGRQLGINPLKPGNTYRYAVKTLIRLPETLFESFRKNSIDRNGNSYTFSPFKFKHPVTLKRGNILTKNSLLSNYAKTQLDFGDTGNVATALFSYKKELPVTYNAQINQVNQNILTISWKTSGDNKMIDHFIVMKKSISGKSIIEKTHSSNGTSDFELLYELKKDDIGEFSFIILPVYNDYSRGEEAETNTYAYID